MKLCNGKSFKVKLCGRFEEDDDDRTAFCFQICIIKVDSTVLLVICLLLIMYYYVSFIHSSTRTM